MSGPVASNVERNAAAHDRVAHVYDRTHSEIYNAVEQARLESTIDELLQLMPIAHPEVLDFGAGTGNLTLKFADRGCRVTAADVSRRSLDRLLATVGPGRQVGVSVLAADRIPFPNASFDIVATYSVLHHIPDYINAVREMGRVLRAGGLLYIDHEFNEAAWQPNDCLVAYRNLTKLSVGAHFWQLLRTGVLFTPAFAATAFMKAFVNRRYEREGDLHVWPDDHIDWKEIEATLASIGMRVIFARDYLLYQPRGGIELYRKFANVCNDTRCIVASKETTDARTAYEPNFATVPVRT